MCYEEHGGWKNRVKLIKHLRWDIRRTQLTGLYSRSRYLRVLSWLATQRQVWGLTYST